MDWLRGTPAKWTQGKHDTSPDLQLTPQPSNAGSQAAGPIPTGKEILRRDRAHRRFTLGQGEPETTAGSVPKRILSAGLPPHGL